MYSLLLQVLVMVVATNAASITAHSRHKSELMMASSPGLFPAFQCCFQRATLKSWEQA